MKKLLVKTANGGVYVLTECSAFGTDAVIGKAGNGELRVYRFEESDVVTEL